MTRAALARSVLALSAVLALPVPARAQAPKAPPPTISVTPQRAGPADAKADEDVLRALGASMAAQLQVFDLSPAELEVVLGGLREGMAGKGKEALQKAAPRIPLVARARRDARFARLHPEGAALLAKAAAAPGAVKTDSGLVFEPLAEGSGPVAGPAPKLKIRYETRLANGTVVDGSSQRGGAVTIMTSAVARCWAEGLARLKVGGKARLTCPPWTAFGAEGAGPIPADATIVTTVELVEVVKEP